MLTKITYINSKVVKGHWDWILSVCILTFSVNFATAQDRLIFQDPESKKFRELSLSGIYSSEYAPESEYNDNILSYYGFSFDLGLTDIIDLKFFIARAYLPLELVYAEHERSSSYFEISYKISTRNQKFALYFPLGIHIGELIRYPFQLNPAIIYSVLAKKHAGISISPYYNFRSDDEEIKSALGMNLIFSGNTENRVWSVWPAIGICKQIDHNNDFWTWQAGLSIQYKIKPHENKMDI